MAKGIFPQMSIPDIINALAGWGLTVSQEQLVRPNADFVEGVYCACLQQVTDLSHESLHDPVHNSLSASQVDDTDLYKAALTNNIMLYHLTRFAKAARVEDFNAKDIYSPERERTLILLSAFINFVKFTEQYCNDFVKDLRDRSDALIVERDQVAQQLTIVQQSIETMKAKIAEDEPRCEELRTENNALRAKMFATKEFQTTAVQDVEQLKAEKNALIKRKEALNGEISSISDAITRTRSRIVQSPERIKRTISTMSTTAIEDKRTVAMHEAKARDLQVKINALLGIEKDIRSCIEQLQTIEKEARSLQVSQKELTDLKDHLDDKTIEKNELRLRQERVEKQLGNAHDKLERARRHAEDKKLASQKTIERLQREYTEMDSERRDNDKQVEELRGEADEVEAKMANHLKKGEAELNELLAEYWKLRHETDVYMETLANKLNMRVIAE
ncbi:Nuf2 family-domain-containing protein [Crucibulum laeve]|uniref:Nuf2 family-domain-containing protein n=1 Tax=Crucibulum laeve TaxID=68775 RepID=A0A5C3MEH9_9AGAR|nr:Nuf2 family-domain-containing protein [Crucibulum laeve]